MKLPLFILLLIILQMSCSDPSNHADLILFNATIWTANPDQPTATAIAIQGNKILAVGNDEEIFRLSSDETNKIDLENKFISPGFIDCHVHFLTGGFNLTSVQLRDAATPEEFTNRIRDFARTQKPGTWILGGDWDHSLWGGELPHRDWLDRFTPDHPVFVNRLDGHMALANSKALSLAGIDDDVNPIEGGSFERDANGRITGMLRDNAMSMIYNIIPDPSDDHKMHALQNSMKYVNSKGVTSVHNVGDGLGEIEIFLKAKQENNLTVRIYAMMPLLNWKNMVEWNNTHGPGDDWLKLNCLKGFVDGSLGSHTAAFFEDYSDKPGDKGFFVNEEHDLLAWTQSADSAGLQVAIHAIGDSAIHTLLNIFESVIQQHGDKDRRFRIEHAQHIHPHDFTRFADLDIIPSMQPYHAIDDGRWAGQLIGSERIKTTYAFRSLLDAGARLAFGSDWFVAPPTPLEGIYAAVTRSTIDDQNPDGWVPDQKITVEEALKAYTIDAAYSSFEEHIKGSLKPGKLADLVVIDQNILAIPAKEIKNAAIAMTLVGGKIVFRDRE